MPRKACEESRDWCARASTAYYQAALIARGDGRETACAVGVDDARVGVTGDQRMTDAFADWYAAARAVLAERDRH